ncbi:MAG: small multi-drug export protein [Filifactor alocis]|nr:small multi-drug export protein [Filifactor alocis]
MLEFLLKNTFLSKEILVVLLSAVPLIELRGAIPLGYALGLPPWHVYALAVIGSSLPSPFLIAFFQRVLNLLKKEGYFPRFTSFLENHIQKRSKKLRSATLLGLYLFVAVPLPTTGAYTGSVLASIFNIRLKYSLPAIILGNMTAGIIIMALSHTLF